MDEAKTILEKQVALCSLLVPERLDEIIHWLHPEDFDMKLWRSIYAASRDHALAGSIPDVVTVLRDASQIYGKEITFDYFPDLTKTVKSEMIQVYATKLKNHWAAIKVRDIFDKGRFEELELANDPVAYMAEVMRKFHTIMPDPRYKFESKQKLVTDSIAEIEKCIKGNDTIGTTYGYESLDRVTGGILPGDQVILAARPGMGKTTLALNICLAAARSGKNVAIGSLEMDYTSLIFVILSIMTGIPVTRMRTGRISGSLLQELKDAKDELNELPITFLPRTSDIDRLCNDVRRLNAQWPIDLFMLDYIQLVQVPGVRNIYDRLTEASHMVRDLATECDMGNLILSQVNRDGALKKQAPGLNMLKGSGTIEEDATHVIMLHRENYYQDASLNENPDNSVYLLLLKNRYGDIGHWKMQYQDRNFIEHDNIPGPNQIDAGMEAEDPMVPF